MTIFHGCTFSPPENEEEFSDEEKNEAVQCYRALTLKACDIIDLAGLPEGDRHIAVRQFVLRQLYVPLRLYVDIPAGQETEDAFVGLERTRENRRLEGAGRGHNQQRGRKKPLRATLGDRIAVARRVVVLGDPGAGKTTLLRWLTTAYLLRLKHDPEFAELPDVATLPASELLPIIIRCRDLGEPRAIGCFADLLRQSLSKSEMSARQKDIFASICPKLLSKGEILLLIDGLDEVADPGTRSALCRSIDAIATTYPDVPIVATSRVVGYREMGIRLSRGFEHTTVSDLTVEEKDVFAERWCAVTEPAIRRQQSTQDLKAAIHSNDRIERLTGNPMLLTTLALVKRKVGKLPTRRAELYDEAVQVLLNWRAELERPLDAREALPQIEYVAYEMCRRGVQQLRKDQILELLERVRVEFPNIRPIRNHSADEFLPLLESRTGILIQSGVVRHDGQSVPVFEFRHLTFQEYLAALALVQGCFPDRDKLLGLAERVGPLAGNTREVPIRDELGSQKQSKEHIVTENWTQALRLCIACCNDDDADAVLEAILEPRAGEDVEVTSRPRAVLAALCLADEPNVSSSTARKVLSRFSEVVREPDGMSRFGRTGVEKAAAEIVETEWAPLLAEALAKEFLRRSSLERPYPGALCGMVAAAGVRNGNSFERLRFEEVVEKLGSAEQAGRISAALGVMTTAYDFSFPQQGRTRVEVERGLVFSALDRLLKLLPNGAPEAHAAAWAIGWLSIYLGQVPEGLGFRQWLESADNLSVVLSVFLNDGTDAEALRWLAGVVGSGASDKVRGALVFRLEHSVIDVRLAVIRQLGEMGGATEALLKCLDDPEPKVRGAISIALGRSSDRRVVRPLLSCLDDSDVSVRKNVIESLGKLADAEAVEPLMARLRDPLAEIRAVTAESLGQLRDVRAVELLLECLNDKESEVRAAVATSLGQLRDKRAVGPLLALFDDEDFFVGDALVTSLGQLVDKEDVEPFRNKLTDSNRAIRQRALWLLGVVCCDKVDLRLLSRDFDASHPWRDPADVILESELDGGSKKIGIGAEEIRGRFERLAQLLHLRLDWI